MNRMHPTAEQLDRYRRGASAPAELLEVDAHVAACDLCFELVRAAAAPVAIPRDHAHLTYEESEAFVDGRAGAIDREVAEAHLATCDRCRGEIRDLTDMREAIEAEGSARPPSPRRWLAAAAVLIALALAGAWWLGRDADGVAPQVVETAPPRPVPEPPRQTVALMKPAIVATLAGDPRVLRGPSAEAPFALRAPIGTVVLDERPEFRWEPAAGAASYEVAVADAESGNVAATGSSAVPSWRPDAPLPRGRTYSWQVRARIGRDSVLSPGPGAAEARFHVASAEIAEELNAISDARERGIALANRGVLDDAEQALARAGAADLLEQVRAWRDYRALPTTTNGAQ
ncbi:MAG TPA: zf-HC2 domain-containing protein [Thermoanaerobaculia bacterium]|nr:zf-HC2 domain-containing protein [Thermoanaerobaculia bacterium]